MNDTDPAHAAVEVLAREHMKELRAKYCWHVSRAEVERIVDLYTPDGIFEFEWDGKRHALKGAQAIRDGMKDRVQPGMIFPMVHNHTFIMKSATEAIGTCTMEAHTKAPDRPPFAGYYHDRFRKQNGRWLFAERLFFYYWPTFERSGLDLGGNAEAGVRR